MAEKRRRKKGAMPYIAAFLLSALLAVKVFAQAPELTVEKIMQDPQWMGTFPSQVFWGEHNNYIYFNYNRDNDPADSLYRIDIKSRKMEKVNWELERQLPSRSSVYDARKERKAYVKNGRLMLYDTKRRQEKELIGLEGPFANLSFLGGSDSLAFRYGSDAYIYDLKAEKLTQLTQIRSGEDPDEKKPRENAKWLKEDNLDLLQVVREREDKKDSTEKIRRLKKGGEPSPFYLGKRNVSTLRVSADAKYVAVNLTTPAPNEGTKVPDYIATDGYTRDLTARSKVGSETAENEVAIFDLERDTLYFLSAEELPGIKDLPDYTTDYPDRAWEEKVREVFFSPVYFSEDGRLAVVQVKSKDSKDRWITRVDLETGSLHSLDRQRDEAWIAGPGIGWGAAGGVLGWLPDNQHIYFQSEESGYSHLYLMDVGSGQKKAITEGDYEVFDPFLSNDKKHWYLTTSAVHPGERHFYRMPVHGGKMERLTHLTGHHEVYLSPDEKWLAIRYSYSNDPWELYLKPNRAAAKEERLTFGQTDEFKAYPWRDPELVEFQASDGVAVPARLYRPNADKKNGAAVIFVHGAGYLQNVHKWWSSYFREYMFHNLLADLGYTVLDIDYRGSAGYGRDWRTAIYRHMGGKDLSDQVDGARYLVESQGIDKDRIGIYGGSYGGFITLMALFNASDIFKSGAALRSVTDWAHYNHPYTANILNQPMEDPIAYRRSSPIYFADGLKGHLLIAHGMVDVNVHFQDVVRLSQRLIELGKDNWELAVYPAEDHGFVEPSSWIDEYKRVLKLFNKTLLE